MFRKIIDSPWLYFGGAAAILVVALTTQLNFDRPPERARGTVEDLASLSERKVNVVFILIDMLRADRLSAYGYERRTSPTMDALARRGIRFATVEAQSSWTKASMASMWTGLYPERTGVQRFMNAVPQEARMPAEIFRDAGYRTAGVWRNGWTANNFGFSQGFDLYIRPTPNRRPRNVQRRSPGRYPLNGTDLDATESAMEFMWNAAQDDDPFFLYVHYMDVHQYLYADISPDFGTSFSDFYDSSIFWVDRNIQYLLDCLRDSGAENDTMIVIASDHGEAFFEHGIEGHARNLYKEVQEVPLIIVPPFHMDQGVVVEERVANVDIWPTMLDLLGFESLPAAEGRSLVPLIYEAARGGAPGLGERPVFAQLDRSWGKVGDESDPLVAVSVGPRRYVHRVNKPELSQLYDRTLDDEDELRNVAAQHPERVAEMREQVEEFLERPKELWESTPEVELDNLHVAQLRALGYVIERDGKAAPETPGRQVAAPRRAAAPAGAEAAEGAPAESAEAPDP